jgi:hypothetical protein
MWFLPTYGRPHNVAALMVSPGGVPHNLRLFLTEDDPARAKYAEFPFQRTIVPANSLCDVLRKVTELFPNEPYYGFLTDDQTPQTPHWWEKLAAAAEDRYIVTSTSPGSTAALSGVPCFGGGLVRAMGSLVPTPGMNHNGTDVVWRQIGDQFGLIKVHPDVLIYERHPIHGTAPMDATYERGAFNQVFGARDAAALDAWASNPERDKMNERITAFLAR